MSVRRMVTLYAVTVEVTCPFCGGCIEAPNESQFWTLAEVEIESARDRDCPECDEPIRIMLREKAICRIDKDES